MESRLSEQWIMYGRLRVRESEYQYSGPGKLGRLMMSEFLFVFGLKFCLNFMNNGLLLSTDENGAAAFTIEKKWRLKKNRAENIFRKTFGSHGTYHSKTNKKTIQFETTNTNNIKILGEF